MSVPTDWVPFAVVGASVLGSGHCATMCGGLALSRSDTRSNLVRYHLGRLVAYLGLGAAAGMVGVSVFGPEVTIWFSWVSSVCMGILFLVLAMKVWRGDAPHFRWVPDRWLVRLFRRRGSFSTGILTGALPCGWLQSFVLSAIATRSPIRGALVLLAFWVGTLPALIGVRTLATEFLAPLRRSSPKIAALLLVVAGTGSFGYRIFHVPFRIRPIGEIIPLICGNGNTTR